jgi:hypothetical protein
MTRERLLAIGIQYVKVAIPTGAAIAFIARVMYQSGRWTTTESIAIGAFCTAIGLLAIGVGAGRSGPYGRNRRRPRRSLAEGLTPRKLCVSSAAVLFVASGVLQALH